MHQPVRDLLAHVVAIDRVAVELLLRVRDPAVTKVMTSVTGLGSASAALAVLGLFYLADWDDEFASLLVALPLAGSVVVPLMAVVQRPFPPQPVCVTVDSAMVAHSFPSGHASVATIYALLARRSDRLPFAVVAVVGAVIAVSRVYLGTHYLSDTVVGVLIGAVAFAAARRLRSRIRPLDVVRSVAGD